MAGPRKKSDTADRSDGLQGHRVRVTSIALYGPDTRKLEDFLLKLNSFNRTNGLPKASRSDVIRRAIRRLRDVDVEIFGRQIAGWYEDEETL